MEVNTNAETFTNNCRPSMISILTVTFIFLHDEVRHRCRTSSSNVGLPSGGWVNSAAKAFKASHHATAHHTPATHFATTTSLSIRVHVSI
jgi:hypothetical protein